MAATAMTPAQLELIDSLSQDDIPIKLRCAICSKLAVAAFRLPCCEQAICETCQTGLPSSCPVCEHSPVTPDDCTPHKSLRTTIKVFLRTEEKKRGALLAKAAKETPPDTPLEPTAPPQIPETAKDEPVDAVAPAANGQEEEATAQEGEGENSNQVQENSFESGDASVEFILTHQDQQDIPHESIEEIAPGQENDEEKSNVDDASTTAGEGNAGTEATAAAPNAFAMPGMNPMMGMMGGIGDMNQMQQMQMMMAMQNGMGGFGGFPMMGMPGMPMDPMTMQQMYMNGGFGGGINMGGMGNMGAGGYEGNQYGQQSWNGGDNFNANVAAGHNDFASSHYPNRGGFNRGGYGRGGFDNFGGGHQGDFYGRGRGRGRGRGGFGRGAWQGQMGGHGGFDASAMGMNPADQMKQMMGQHDEAVSKETATAETTANVDEFGREIRAATAEEGDAKTSGDAAADGNSAKEGAEPTVNGEQVEAWSGEQENGGEYNANYGPGDWSNNQGYDMHNAGYNQQYMNQGYNGYMNGSAPPQPVDVPINAPTGPKAMREGLPNIGLVHLKGRSGSFARPYSSGSGANNIEVADRSSKQYDKEREEYARQREERHKSRDRSRDRDDRHSRRHRDRDEETSDDARESERRRERRRRRREEAEAAAAEGGDAKEGDAKDDATIDGDSEDHARSASPTESRRDSHRSSRRDKERSDRHSERDRHRDRSRHRERDDKDRDREREREKDKSSRSSRSERDRDSKHHSSSHHRRNRSRSRSRDKDEKSSRSSRRDRDRDRDRDSDRDRDRDTHRSRRHKDVAEPVLKPPTGPRSMSIFDNGPAKGGGIQIRGAGSRGKENPPGVSGKAREKEKEVDPHTAEREARNRERLLKEAQRMAGLAGLVGVAPQGPRGGKREREEERGGRRKRRGRGVGGMDGADDERPDEAEGEEERIRRNEREREGARGR